jgi:hypothetical protein
LLGLSAKKPSYTTNSGTLKIIILLRKVLSLRICIYKLVSEVLDFSVQFREVTLLKLITAAR